MPPQYGPKKPSTSYFMFMATARDKMKAANPEASTTQLSQLLGEQWRGLTPDAKAVFEKQASDDKLRYQKEYEQWTVNHPDEVALANAAKEDKKRGKKRSKEEGAPKRALSAYIFYTNSVREETKKEAPDAKVIQAHCTDPSLSKTIMIQPTACIFPTGRQPACMCLPSGISTLLTLPCALAPQITDLSKMMGVKWKGLTDEQKAPYLAMAEKDKVRYQQEKAAWEQEVAVKRRQLELQQHQQALYQQQYAQPQYQQQYVQQVQPQQYAQQQYVQQQAQYASAGYQQQASDLGWWQ